MHFKKYNNHPLQDLTTILLSKRIGDRIFQIDVCYANVDDRRFVARRIRNSRQYLREFILDELKKVVDIGDALL